MEEFIKEFLKYGIVPTILLIVLFLIVQEPDRALKIKSLVIKPFFYLFNWCSKSYISSQVSFQTNTFLNNTLSLLPQSEKYNVKVKWVSSINDPILSEEGKIILRLKEDKDQTKNILSAVHMTLPIVICPFARRNISSTCTKSIDLTILKKLSEGLGRSGKIVFKKYFLDPETENDENINRLITKLYVLDSYGIFIPIFINELEQLGELLYSEPSVEDFSTQVVDFIEYLLNIAQRSRGQNITLEHIVEPFKLSTILLAKAEKADKQGLKPYLRRLTTNIDNGSENIYIIAFPSAFDFFERLMKALEAHERVIIKKILKTTSRDNTNNKTVALRIALLSRNDIVVDTDFEQRILANGIHEGAIISGTVEDISVNESLVNLKGMRAYISKNECAWFYLKSCGDILVEGQQYNFVVKNIDRNANQISLSLRLPQENPWNIIQLPNVDSIIRVKIIACSHFHLICLFQEKLEVYIAQEEISWFTLHPTQYSEYINTIKDVKVINIDEGLQKIFCSLRQIDEDPWPTIHESLPIGTEFDGKVVGIEDSCIQVELPNNYRGIIPKERLIAAGYEYANYKENMIIGQGIQVVVSKVFINKKKIRLDLKRNVQ